MNHFRVSKSTTWEVTLGCRDEMQNFIKYKVANGNITLLNFGMTIALSMKNH